MFQSEKRFQDEIQNNQSLQKDICSILNIDFDKSSFVREDRFINNIVADFSIFENGKVRAIMECKGGNINITDFVRGIGQIFQYEYFAEERLSSKEYEFVEFNNFHSVYIFPDSVLRNNDFNVGLFKYPKSKKILEVNSNNLAIRLIDESELERLKESKLNNLKVISQYYIRDNRLFEIYFLLRILMIYKLKNKKVHRNTMWDKGGILQKLQTINNKNWKNAFISLSSLGFIDNKNYPTQSGSSFANMSFEIFAVMIFNSYLMPYYNLIFQALNTNSNVGNKELCSIIKDIYKTKSDILFLTQSNGRYISSWLNIARDDYAILKFETRSKIKEIIFNPFQANKESFVEHIKKYSKINEYKERFEKVCDEI